MPRRRFALRDCLLTFNFGNERTQRADIVTRLLGERSLKTVSTTVIRSSRKKETRLYIRILRSIRAKSSLRSQESKAIRRAIISSWFPHFTTFSDLELVVRGTRIRRTLYPTVSKNRWIRSKRGPSSEEFSFAISRACTFYPRVCLPRVHTLMRELVRYDEVL